MDPSCMSTFHTSHGLVTPTPSPPFPKGASTTPTPPGSLSPSSIPKLGLNHTTGKLYAIKVRD
ncbi:hypothetical protein HMI55_002985 [Coelomomyces lativittatus]|nr:hypothetical protein HMI55_002985 [Coelomomyces lativittatus]